MIYKETKNRYLDENERFYEDEWYLYLLMNYLILIFSIELINDLFLTQMKNYFIRVLLMENKYNFIYFRHNFWYSYDNDLLRIL